jgi:deoxyribonuclease-4
MLIGGHVSTAGGLANAVTRGSDIGCSSIQIFNQSPRAWRPTRYTEENFAEFREAMDASAIAAVIIHAVYLINTATLNDEVRVKSLDALTHALRIGDGIGASGVVLHAGSAKTGDPVEAIIRSGEMISAALAETESCPVLIEGMAGHKGILGNTFEEIEAIIEVTGGHERMGFCLDSCHLFAGGYDIRTREGLDEVLADADRRIGLDRLGALHLNDSVFEFGSRRDRHADLGEGMIGKKALGLFLSEPRFEGLPATMETPGPDRKGVTAADIKTARRLRTNGLRFRRRAAGTT